MTNDFLDNLGAIQYQKMHDKPKRDESAHLSYNRERPTKVSPGVWKFYAVEMNHACRREGHCRERVYHACLLGKTLHIC